MAENTLLEKVLSLQDKYRKLEESLADPAVIADAFRTNTGSWKSRSPTRPSSPT